MAGAMKLNKKGMLLAAIGDEDTCTGLLLGGIGDVDDKRRSNFMVVDKDTPVPDIETKMRELLKRTDICIILINQHIADEIQNVITGHEQMLPTIVVIPSKEHAYDPNKDPEMIRAKLMFSGDA